MIDMWSLALGILLGAIGMAIEGYVLYGSIRETERICESQLRRREEWIRCLEMEISRLKKERAAGDVDNGSNRLQIHRQQDV